jgi:hypothetical protein
VKKFLGIALAFSLVWSLAAPAFGAEENSQGLEQAILKVKSVVTIPEDYTDFQYSSRQYQEDGKTVSVWDLNWNKEDFRGGISAAVEDGAYLTSYSKYYDRQNEGLGAVSRDAGRKTAEDFLAKAVPGFAADLRLEKNTDNAGADRHYYRYKPYKNDTVVSYVEVSVEVDKHTGEVMGFYARGAGEDLTKLPAVTGVIGPEAAKTAWMDAIDVPLSYYSNYDYSKKP